MNKEKFLAGKKFCIKGFSNTVYFFEISYIADKFGYHANIDSVEEEGVYWFTIKMGQEVKGFTSYKDMKLIG